MKSRRILSMLLVAAIGMSSFALPTFALQGKSESETAAVNLSDSEWKANGNAVKTVTDGNTAGAPADYIRVFGANGKQGYIYSSHDMGTLVKDNTYKLSFWVRLSPDTVNVSDESSAVKSLELRLGGWYSGSTVSTKNFTIVSCDENGSPATAGSPSLNKTWTKYTVVFTPKNNLALKFPGILINSPAPSRAFDVGGFSLTQVAQNDAGKYVELEGSEKYNDSSWTSPVQYWACNYVGAFATYSRFMARSDSGYLVPVSDGEAPEITYSGISIPAGKYELSGKFALNGLNLAKYTFADGYSPAITGEHSASLTLKVISGSRVIASAMQEITHEANTYTYTIDIKDDIPSAEISLSLGENEAFRFENITLTKIADLNYSDEWVDGNGNKSEVFANTPDLDPDIADHYYRFKDSSVNSTRHVFRYMKSNFALNAGTTYEMSVWMRFAPDAIIPAGATNVSKGVYVMWDHPWYNSNDKRLSLKGDNGIVNVTYLDEGNGDENQDGDGMLTLTREWTKYTIRFTVDENTSLKNFGIYFVNGVSAGYTIPVDVAGLSVVALDENGAVSGSELAIDTADNWMVDAGPGVSFNTSVKETVYALTADEYYRIHAGTNATLATPDGVFGMATAEAGLYSVSAFFRAPNGDAKLSAEFSGEVLETIGGETEVSLDSGWKMVTFALDLYDSSTWSELAFMLDGALDLDIADFSAVQLEKYVYAEEFETVDGLKLNVINNSGYLDPAISDHYYRFGDSSENSTRHAFRYMSSNCIVNAGTTYEMTMWMRFAPDAVVPDGVSNVSNGVYVMWDHPWYNSNDKRLSLKGDNGLINVTYLDEGNGDGIQDGDGKLTLSTEWTKYTIRFTVDEYTWLKNYGIYFVNGEYAQYTLPVDIAGLSVVALDENGAATGSELIVDTDGNWKTDVGYGVSFNTSVMETIYDLTADEYYRANAAKDGVTPTAIRPVSDEELIKGIYHITGMFRTPEGSANLSAQFGGAELTTQNGASSVELTDKWSEQTFILNTMIDGLTMGDITLSLDACTNLDIYGVSITLVERHISVSDVNLGTIITLLLLKKEYAIDESELDPNNLMATAVTKGGLRRWEYGDQSLEVFTDADGVRYMQASKITSNKLGFTYEDGTVLKEGYYRFKGEFRTSNEGEDGMVRLSLGDSTAASLIDNEWREVSVIAELKDDIPLSVKIFGGAVASSTQDYQFRNLELVDLANDPIPYEYYSSDFEDESAINSWSTGGQGAGTFTWNSEDGNGYMTVSGRAASHTPIYYNAGVYTIPGATYVISYDIRTTVPGEETVARANINWNNITVDEPVDAATPNLYSVTNEWRHIEHTYVPTIETALSLMINTAPGEEYNASLDIDNVKIVRMIGIRPNYYAAGNFDNAGTALAGWSTGGQGAVSFTWNEEDGNGYVTASGRASNMAGAYRDFGIKTVPGKTYKISFDIRTSNPGEKTVVRTKVVYVALEMKPGQVPIEITNDWTHVEISYKATTEAGLWMMIFGGPNAAYTHDFDFDNVTLDIVD